MTHAQDEVPQPAGSAEPHPASAGRETTAIDGRIPAALLQELADELEQLDDQSQPEAEGTGLGEG